MRVILFLMLSTLFVSGCKKSLETDTPEDANPEKTAKVETDGNWVSDSWNQAVSQTGKTVNGTTDWITGMYQVAKDQGVTSAQNVQDWVASDLKAQGDWQYKIVAFESSDASKIESELNQLGDQRWECYHVKTNNDEWTFFLKRSKKSYLKNLPIRDLAGFLPAVTGSDEQ